MEVFVAVLGDYFPSVKYSSCIGELADGIPEVECCFLFIFFVCVWSLWLPFSVHPAHTM